jgi:hypothetical protein
MMLLAFCCLVLLPPQLILVGTITDNVKVETKIDHKLFSHMILDPSQQQLATVNGDTVTIRDAQDEETIWDELERAAASAKIVEPPLPLDLQQPFAKALDQLRSEAYAVVTLPDSRGRRHDHALLSRITTVLDDQIAQYSVSLGKCKENPDKHADDFNNVLRISYNFSTET